MIKSFDDTVAETIWSRRLVKSVAPEVQKACYRKLQMINAAADINDLRVPPGNRLKALQGRWKTYYQIRINDQYRLRFQWKHGHAEKVAFGDWHDER